VGGKELLFPARLIVFGYSYRIEAEIQERKVLFERDEEGAWRALLQEEDLNRPGTPSRGLLEATASALDELLK
jgi:hypothetical protein